MIEPNHREDVGIHPTRPTWTPWTSQSESLLQMVRKSMAYESATYIYIYKFGVYNPWGYKSYIYHPLGTYSFKTSTFFQRIFSAKKMAWLGARSRFEHFAHALPSTKPGTGGPGTTVNNCPNYRTLFFFPAFLPRSKKKRKTGSDLPKETVKVQPPFCFF